jgi:hypothetical protein
VAISNYWQHFTLSSARCYLEGAAKHGHAWGINKGPTLTDAQRWKIERDKTRVRRRNVQWKRLHVLNNPSKLASRRWKEVPKPWTYADCE